MVAVGKLAYGFSSPILASAGLVKLPFYKYARAAIPVTLTQYAIFLGMGYYFAGSYQVFGAYFKYAEIAVASAVIIFIFIFFVVRKLTADYVKRNILNDKLVNRI
jgi:membrane protein DedA with SNARE-associated domain